ncbi:MAG: hypothetical protein V1698_01430, partial [bacterium]
KLAGLGVGKMIPILQKINLKSCGDYLRDPSTRNFFFWFMFYALYSFSAWLDLLLTGGYNYVCKV